MQAARPHGAGRAFPLLGTLVYAGLVVALAALAGLIPLSGYVLNILMQATPIRSR